MRRIIAALTFFTRIPLWRLVNVTKQDYEHVVPLWPLMGWLTGGVMALVFWLSQMVFPVTVSLILALSARVLFTGALHEDGFADFWDGFGGGTDRARTLSIMKDSHIGTYGVLSLLVYYIILWSTLTALMPKIGTPFLFVAVDSLCKYMSSTIIYFLPYARTEASAKNQLVYARVSIWEKVYSLVFAIIPLAILPFTPIVYTPTALLIYMGYACIAAIIVAAGLFVLMHKRIQGYTGDCCGATFIILEAVFYLVLLAVN
ncbi:MAG: adenosylcobinamide-GDP ribazoletransferase [Bacteroidaceae bacterium]|nr:adenosylcobinamide-GDP ribazoletransferase [Bacteroidaceae bacterium]